MRRYRAAPAGALAVAPLDLLTAVHHRPSGVTHLVDAPVPELLELLDDRPATAAELLARLQAAFEVGDADEAALAARLEEMVALGLARLTIAA